MSKAIEDFWPSSFRTADADPEAVDILKEQAKVLGEKTNGVVEGVVKDSTIEGTVYYSLHLKAPALGGSLFKVLHIAFPVTQSPNNPYPFVGEDAFGGDASSFANIAEFKTWLKATLSSQLMAGVIGNLIRRSKTRNGS